MASLIVTDHAHGLLNSKIVSVIITASGRACTKTKPALPLGTEGQQFKRLGSIAACRQLLGFQLMTLVDRSNWVQR